MQISPEDFEAWLANPITAALMDSARKKADAAKQAWAAASWSKPIADMNKLDVTQLAYLRGKAEIFESFARIEMKDLFKPEQKSNGTSS